MSENKVGLLVSGLLHILKCTACCFEREEGGGPSRSERCCKLSKVLEFTRGEAALPCEFSLKIFTNRNPCESDVQQFIFPPPTQIVYF